MQNSDSEKYPEQFTESMSEIKIVKALTPEQRNSVKEFREMFKSDLDDMARRFASVLETGKQKLAAYDRLLKN